MKRATWVIATCVVVATAFSFTLAQERKDLGDRYRLDRTRKGDLQYFPRKTAAAKTTKKTESKAKSTIFTEDLTPRTKTYQLKSASRTVAGGHPLSKEQPHKNNLITADYIRSDAFPKGAAIQQVGSGSPFGEAAPMPPSRSFQLQPPVPEIHKTTATSPFEIRKTSFAIPAALSTIKIPSGAQSPTVTVKWVQKGDINVGQKCACQLVVKNSGLVDARDILVETNFPASVRLISAKPAPSETRERAVWTFRSLSPGEEKTIDIQLIPSRPGPLRVQAAVRFTGFAAASFTVKEPMLKIAMSGPTKVMVGDAASQLIVVSNPGTGVARQVAIEAWIPKGLEHPRGERLVMEIGALSPGETRKVRLSLTATSGGEQTVKVKATADAAISQQHQRLVTVSAPSLKIALAGPGLRYLGRNAVYKISISNDGGVATNNVRVLHRLPKGFKFVQADKGGSFDAGKRTISWFVGRVEPGKIKHVSVVVAATKLGNHLHHAGAISEQGAKADSQLTTRVDGNASLVVDIVDLDDPVEVGTETAYEVRVRNAGSKAAANVQITCEVPRDVELKGVKGPTQADAKDGLIVFHKVATLPPGKTAIFRVHVRGKVAGNHRFRVRLTSDTITKPLTYDELTKFYRE